MWLRCLNICYIILRLANYKIYNNLSTDRNVHCGDYLPGLKDLSRFHDKHLRLRTMTRVPHVCQSCQRILEDGPVIMFKCFIVSIINKFAYRFLNGQRREYGHVMETNEA